MADGNYQGACSCGWLGTVFYTNSDPTAQADAQAEADAHNSQYPGHDAAVI